MNAWFPPLRARAALIFSAALVAAGLVPLLYFVGLVAWQIAMLFQTRAWVPLPASLLFTDHSFAFIPEFPWAWLMSPDSLLPVHTAAMWVLSLDGRREPFISTQKKSRATGGARGIDHRFETAGAAKR